MQHTVHLEYVDFLLISHTAYLNHGNLIGDQAVANHYIALLNVQTLLCNCCCNEQIDLPLAKPFQDILLLSLFREQQHSLHPKATWTKHGIPTFHSPFPETGILETNR